MGAAEVLSVLSKGIRGTIMSVDVVKGATRRASWYCGTLWLSEETLVVLIEEWTCLRVE